jgi:hypothetical protein
MKDLDLIAEGIVLAGVLALIFLFAHSMGH